MFETEIEVRYAETDKMGVVHHAVYPVWFEVARTEFLRNIGIPYDSLEEKGVMLPLSEISCKYLKAARYGYTVKVQLFPEKVNGVKICIKYRVLDKKDDTLIATGDTVNVWTDTDMNLINISKKMPEIYKQLCNETIAG